MSTQCDLYIFKRDNKETANAFGIRFPNLWKDKVKDWFTNFECITNDLGRTDDELAEDVVKKLDAVDKILVSDITEYPPLNDYYKTLKNRLVLLYHRSDLESRAMLVVWSSESYKQSRNTVFEQLDVSGKTFKKFVESSTHVLSIVEGLVCAKLTQESESILKDNHNLGQQSSVQKKKVKKSGLPYCYYHERFGSEAHNCAEPCGYGI